jgi:hypothetical protein
LKGKMGLCCSSGNNHVVGGEKTPPWGHDYSLGKKKGLSCSLEKFKLLPGDVIIP